MGYSISIRIVARRLGYNQRHVASITHYDCELPSGYSWTDTAGYTWRSEDKRRAVFAKATVVGWASGQTDFNVDGVAHHPEFYVNHGGRTVIATVHYPQNGLHTASTGWLQTVTDYYKGDNLLSLPDC